MHAPGTTGNFGPGFDTLSMALRELGDRVTLSLADEDRITVEGPGAAGIPTTWTDNVAGRTLDRLRAGTGVGDHFHVTLHKPRRGGSGLGSSASSAGGVALAFHGLHPDAGLRDCDLWAAARHGEELAGDNPEDVAAVILGGLVVVQPAAGMPVLHRVPPPEDLVLAVAVPDLELATREMRALLPPSWPRDDVVWNLGQTAALVKACYEGDVAAMGACLQDRLAEPYRGPRWPHLDAARRAARDAGAYGAAIAGSGPAVFAVCDSPSTARDAAAAMADAVRQSGFEAESLVAFPEDRVMHDAVPMREL